MCSLLLCSTYHQFSGVLEANSFWRALTLLEGVPTRYSNTPCSSSVQCSDFRTVLTLAAGTNRRRHRSRYTALQPLHCPAAVALYCSRYTVLQPLHWTAVYCIKLQLATASTQNSEITILTIYFLPRSKRIQFGKQENKF